MGKTMKNVIKHTPIINRLRRRSPRTSFVGSTEYWKQRYAVGRTSGVGSYGRFADFKAQVLNEFVRAQSITSVIEYGCGDGNQLALAQYPSYIGFDVSPDVITLCHRRFEQDDSKSFKLMDEYAGERATLTLSLDVIYHLVEDEVFARYMEMVFDSSDRFVIVYSSNADENDAGQASHVRHRRFTDWVEVERPGYRLFNHIPNPYPYTGDHRTGSFADFYMFQRTGSGQSESITSDRVVSPA
jgi:SAM-dependent methyltransferase